jgi:hypothetical protein
MEMQSFCETCLCGKSFAQPGAFTNHQRYCLRSKRRLSDAISAARDVWKEKRSLKRQRLSDAMAPDSDVSISRSEDSSDAKAEWSSSTHAVQPNAEPPSAPDPVSTIVFLPHHYRTTSNTCSQHFPVIYNPDPEILPEDLERPIAERRTRRTIRIPSRFRDSIPEACTSLPPPEVLPLTVGADLVPPFTASGVRSSTASHECVTRTPDQRGVHVLKTSRNIFGLFQQYEAENFPSHDPEEELTAADLLEPDNITVTGQDIISVNQPKYGPYPNESSFLLGEWFWNGTIQKSKSSFNNLVDIICSPNFRSEDIRDTNWNLVDQRLGGNEDFDLEWLDFDDATWTQTSVEIEVPFHQRTANPGPKTFTIPHFFHRSVVSIIKEKITNLENFRYFHLEPFELHWQPGQATKPVRVYGELYTSPEFLKAHQDLQSSPPEPSCVLPRHVVALMFASDATQLTNFGDASLWPLYMFFGNDSKYRRCKPSLHLCAHVAYLRKVRPNRFSLPDQISTNSSTAS